MFNTARHKKKIDFCKIYAGAKNNAVDFLSEAQVLFEKKKRRACFA